MASRELNIILAAKNLTGRAFGEVRGEMRGLQSEARRGVANVTRNLGYATVAAAGFVAVQVKAGLDSLAELERVNAQTAAVLASTNNAAGITAGQVRSLAEELEDLTTVDDKAIQNTENLLLTFTSINKEAFKPALESILDMNAALGGDEASLQGVAIQVGKALQDPVRGLTALRRVGVNFTKEQQDQIKQLVKSNDLYGAQQVILAELAKEFGGSAAAQADTFGGKMRRIADAVEDAQMALATAFLPVIEKVADKMGTFLKDPAVLANISEFGETIAGGLDDAIDMVADLPWPAIGEAFKLMGSGAKAALDLFLSAPPWLQTAVITGWGLNKLTGGALGTIVGSLASGLIRGILGINAGVVNINAAVVNGGVPGVGGGAPIAAGPNLLKTALVATGGVAIGGFLASGAHESTVAPARKFEETQFNALTSRLSTSNSSLKDIDAAIATLEAQQRDIGSNQVDWLAAGASELSGIFTGQKGVLSTLNDQLSQLREQRASIIATRGSAAESARWAGLAKAELTKIAGKNFSPNVSVNANLTNVVSVSAQQVVKTTTRIAGTTTVGGFTETW